MEALVKLYNDDYTFDYDDEEEYKEYRKFDKKMRGNPLSDKQLSFKIYNKKTSCLWIDPTMKAGYYITDSLLASIYIAITCCQYELPFQSLLLAWHRMLYLCKQSLNTVKNKDIKTKFITVADTIKNQGQVFCSGSSNFIYDLFINSKFNCHSGVSMLYAIFEALEPKILENVYFFVVPKHIFLILKQDEKYSFFETTFFETEMNIVEVNSYKEKLLVEYDDITQMLLKIDSFGLDKYSSNIEIEKVFGTKFPSVIFKSRYLIALYAVIKFKKDNNENVLIRNKFYNIMKRVKFCDEGYIQQYLCLILFSRIYDTSPELKKIREKRKRILKKKIVTIICDDLPLLFRNFYFKDKKSINMLAGGITNILIIYLSDSINIYINEYIEKNKIRIKSYSKVIKL
jgi:hypothetical protein